MSSANNYPQGVVPQSTIVPTDDALFTPYFTRTYEGLAQAINAKDNTYFPIPITSTATDIPNVSRFGSFVVCVSGTSSSLPTLIAALCKADSGAVGSVASLASQAGTGTWAAKTLTITSTATNFQIAHNNAGITGSFNIKIIGTQS
jgi:hypothetical protein